MTLNIAPGFTLPDQAVTETFGILAVRRSGKSNAAVVMAEQMYDAGLPWVAIDPKGDWWGMRSSGDGKKPGLSVLVFGGDHADVPLEPTGGELVADLIVDQRITCILDISEMIKAEQTRFLLAFANRLYKRNRKPLHVFCEEADEYIPQQVLGEDAKVVRAFAILIKRGGHRGIGSTLITQRSASLNNNVLTQVETLFAMRTLGTSDRKAVKDWATGHDTGVDVVAELPHLHQGEAWVFSPHFLQTVQKIQFRRRRTFDSGATPKVGEEIITPTRRAGVDLAAIKEAMAETIERAQENDPKALRAELARLRARVAELESAGVPEPVEVPVPVPVLTEETIARINESMAATAAEVRRTLDAAFANLKVPVLPKLTSIKAPALPKVTPPVIASGRSAPRAVPSAAADIPLGKAERLILTALAEHPTHRRTIKQIAIVTNYSAGGGGFRNSIGRLRSNNLIFSVGVGEVEATEAGIDALGDYTPLPRGQELLEHWYTHAQIGKAHRLILEALVAAWPDALSADVVGEQTGYQASGGGFRNAIGRLRTLELITGNNNNLRASDELFEEN